MNRGLTARGTSPFSLPGMKMAQGASAASTRKAVSTGKKTSSPSLGRNGPIYSGNTRIPQVSGNGPRARALRTPGWPASFRTTPSMPWEAPAPSILPRPSTPTPLTPEAGSANPGRPRSALRGAGEMMRSPITIPKARRPARVMRFREETRPTPSSKTARAGSSGGPAPVPMNGLRWM